eukprot:2690579-Rhodomonas_salina.1
MAMACPSSRSKSSVLLGSIVSGTLCSGRQVVSTSVTSASVLVCKRVLMLSVRAALSSRAVAAGTELEHPHHVFNHAIHDFPTAAPLLAAVITRFIM